MASKEGGQLLQKADEDDIHIITDSHRSANVHDFSDDRINIVHDIRQSANPNTPRQISSAPASSQYNIVADLRQSANPNAPLSKLRGLRLDQLPDETIIKIFNLVLSELSYDEDSPIPHGDGAFERDRFSFTVPIHQAMILSHISARLRANALDIPHLWAYLRSNMPAEQLTAFILRSRKWPLQILIRLVSTLQDNDRNEFVARMKLICMEHGRWEVASFDFGNAEQFELPLSRPTFPMLKEIHVNNTFFSFLDASKERVASDLAGWSAPKLQVFRAHTVLPRRIPTTNLVELTLSPGLPVAAVNMFNDMKTILSHLSQCGNLQKLTFHITLSYGTRSFSGDPHLMGVRAVTLPRLTFLDLWISNLGSIYTEFIAHIIMPNLEHLKMKMDNNRNIEAVLQHLERTSHDLRCFTFNSCYFNRRSLSPRDWSPSPFLHYLSNVDEIHVSSITISDSWLTPSPSFPHSLRLLTFDNVNIEGPVLLTTIIRTLCDSASFLSFETLMLRNCWISEPTAPNSFMGMAKGYKVDRNTLKQHVISHALDDGVLLKVKVEGGETI